MNVQIGDSVEGKSLVTPDVPVRGVVNGIFSPELVLVAQGINSRLCQDPRVIPITELSKEEIGLLGDFMDVHLTIPKLQIGDSVEVHAVINNQWVWVRGRLCGFGNIMVCVQTEQGHYQWGTNPKRSAFAPV